MSEQKKTAATVAAVKGQAQHAQQKAAAQARTLLKRSTEAVKTAGEDLKNRAPTPGAASAPERGDRQDIAGVDGIYTIVFNRLRNWLARSALRYSIILNLVLCAVNVALGVSIAAISTQAPPEPKYFATNPDGTIMELIPLNKPMSSKSVVLSWATRVVTQCYTFSFTNMDRVVRDCENAHFTEAGAGGYRRALTAARLFEDVKNLELFMETSSPEAAVILDTGEIDGRLAYKVKIPITTRWVGPRTAESSKRQHIFVIALRVPPTESKDGSGIAVHQFVVE
ncbi:MAG: hypothetical protein CVV05_00745 [Gammaproteobacteria bacterium HGW-Gammaproteobacteria-1]|jgi:intracellular multiplication protein IcmL|nr:MAG: hypothetical protein CVV05_00745 [Gammaproteobacteria bacterium HGW-Gammaproteobacteria-1]